MAYFRLMRPAEWVKNLVVLIGPFFALRLVDRGALIAFVSFCLISSAVYVINDIADREADKAHPTKRHRPIASGLVTVPAATGLAVVLVAGSLSIAFLLPRIVLAIIAGYFMLMLGYSFGLKKRPILDVIIIATGFVLRAVAGAAAVHALVSPWLVACTFTLCMFLGFGKRRCELATLSNREEAAAHRSTLLRYSTDLLNSLTSVTAGIAIMTFLLYTMDTTPALHPPFRKEWLLYTLPLVAYALFRYAMLIESGGFTGPMQIISRDKALMFTCLLWAVIAGGIALATRDPRLGPHAPSAPIAALPGADSGR